MTRTLIWSLGVAILFAACSNDDAAPGSMTPAVNMTGGAAGTAAVPTGPGVTAGTPGSSGSLATSPGAAGMLAPTNPGTSSAGSASPPRAGSAAGAGAIAG